MKYIPILIIILLLLTACSSEDKESDTEDKVTDTKQPDADDTEDKETKQTEPETITHELPMNTDGISAEVMQNTKTKQITVKTIMRISDNDEILKTTEGSFNTIPSSVNRLCAMFADTFFSPESLDKFLEQAKDKTNLFDGYTITKNIVEFIDHETEEKIADCTATGKDWEDIEFNSYKEFENPFQDQVIGVKPVLQE